MASTYPLLDAPGVTARRTRHRRRDLVALKPEPRPISVTTRFLVPDRVFHDEELSPMARVVVVALCSIARNGEIAIAPINEDICVASGLRDRAVDTSLSELENAGLIYRSSQADGGAARAVQDAKLEALGYCCPWAARGEPLPFRVIVLLWRLSPVGLPFPGATAPARI